jgi:hypothetical protein
MQALLLITVIAVAASGLFTALTFNNRIKATIDPGIESAKNSVVKHIREEAAQAGQEREALHDQLNRVESRADGLASLLTLGLEGITNTVGRIEARQAEFGDRLQEASTQMAELSESLGRQFGWVQEIERLAKSNESVIARKFTDFSEWLRELNDQHSATAAGLAEIRESLDACLEMSRQEGGAAQ